MISPDVQVQRFIAHTKQELETMFHVIHRMNVNPKLREKAKATVMLGVVEGLKKSGKLSEKKADEFTEYFSEILEGVTG